MTRCFFLSSVAALGLAVAGCERSATSSGGEAKTEARKPHSEVHDSAAVVVKTKSGVPMVYILGGQFTMGSDRGEVDELPAHRVQLNAFLMDQSEVTHEMFAKVQLPDPSHWQDSPNKPVERVRWRDAKQ